MQHAGLGSRAGVQVRTILYVPEDGRIATLAESLAALLPSA
jgi:hypothetical protein